MEKIEELYYIFHGDSEIPEDYYDEYEDLVENISEEDINMLKIFHKAQKPFGYHAPLSHRKKTFIDFISCDIDSYIDLAEMYIRFVNENTRCKI